MKQARAALVKRLMDKGWNHTSYPDPSVLALKSPDGKSMLGLKEDGTCVLKGSPTAAERAEVEEYAEVFNADRRVHPWRGGSVKHISARGVLIEKFVPTTLVAEAEFDEYAAQERRND